MRSRARASGSLGCTPAVRLARMGRAVTGLDLGRRARRHPAHREPVTTGVPLPAGRVPGDGRSGSDGAGRAVPSQSRVLERWPDGSARWVRRLPRDRGPRDTVTYSARDGRPPTRRTGRSSVRPRMLGPAAPNGPCRCSCRVTAAPSPRRLLDDGARATVAVPKLVADGGPSDAVAGARSPSRPTARPHRAALRGRYADDLTWEARVAVRGSPACACS